MAESSLIFPTLQGHQYINLTTYRKSGAAVATPVWFALSGDKLYIVTAATSGKVKRIKNNPQVQLAPSDGRGQPRGDTVAGVVTAIHNEQSGHTADQALKKKYGWMYGAFALFWRLRRITPAFLEIQPA